MSNLKTLAVLIISLISVACGGMTTSNEFVLDSSWTPEEVATIRAAAQEWEDASEGEFTMNVYDAGTPGIKNLITRKDPSNWCHDLPSAAAYHGFPEVTGIRNFSIIVLCHDAPEGFDHQKWIYHTMLHEMGHHFRDYRLSGNDSLVHLPPGNIMALYMDDNEPDHLTWDDVHTPGMYQ